MESTPVTPKEPPAGVLILREVPSHSLPDELLRRLAREAKERHPLEGTFVNLEDKVILAVEAPDRAFLREARQRRAMFGLAWMWQTVFGSMATVTAWVREGSGFARFCADGHSAIWDRIQEGETPTYLVLCHEGAVALVTLGERRRGAIAEFEKNRPGEPLARDTRAAYWELFESDSWRRRMTASDRLQWGWAAAVLAPFAALLLTELPALAISVKCWSI